MTEQSHSSIPTPKKSNSAVNIGIGVLMGLIVALIVTYFAMGSGPFRDKSSNTVLTPPTSNTDPNTPLYGNNANNTSVSTNQAPDNAQGNGIGALLGGKVPTNHQSTTAAPNGTPPTENLSNTDTNVSPVISPPISPSAPPSSNPSHPTDPIGDLIKNKPNSSSNAASHNVTPTTAPKASSSTNKSRSRFTIQAGSYNSESEANALKDKLTTQGQKATVSTKQTPEGPMYRVRVGSYNTAKEAQSANNKIKGVVLDVSP